jgi:7-cyano-7-deazaguanine reductase
MANPKLLETFPNPAPHRDFVIAHTHHEFTSLCPMTGHPDFAHITVRYVAGKTCVELKSLKLYFHAYRNEGIFFEAATNQICDDLGEALRPRSLEIVADWKARGGFSSLITARWSPGKAGKKSKAAKAAKG